MWKVGLPVEQLKPYWNLVLYRCGHKVDGYACGKAISCLHVSNFLLFAVAKASAKMCCVFVRTA